MNITNPHGANITILMPGSCNAHCDFCFWNRDGAKTRPPKTYFDQVFGRLNVLPKGKFEALSISGGEPTLSPYLPEFLERLRQYRRSEQGTWLKRVVLTTYGGNLKEHLALVGSTVDHINISRHAVTTEENFAVFKTDRVPTNKQLRKLIKCIHENTVCDVTLNCVLQNGATSEFCHDFINKASKSLGADAVSFRKIAGDTTPTHVETVFAETYGVRADNKCPVCRSMQQTVNGFPVSWKSAVAEPSIATKGLYEIVIRPDGLAYADWSRSVPLPLVLKSKVPKLAVRIVTKDLSARRITHAGCGSSAGGCGYSHC